MTRRLIVRPQALRELAEATQWYEAQRPGLGGEFVRAFETAATAILRNPFQYQMFGEKARRARMHGFPHGLMYTVKEDAVIILACFHGSRNPRPWLE